MKKLSKLKIIILLGAYISIHAGVAYAEDLYGTFPAGFNLINLNGTNGFATNGMHPQDGGGDTGSSIGDVNGDGIDDIIIGAPNANNGAGQSYVVFGSKKPWSKSINLTNLDGSNGFAINGVHAYDTSGIVSGAGDVNGDGIDDIVIGANGANNTGQSYVVFGSKKAWPAAMNLADLNGNNGFAMNGINLGDGCGGSVSGAGDVNGDGIDDILIGAPGANNVAGQSYIVFGSKEAWPEAIDLADLNGSNGFSINGIKPGDASGFSVSGAGDVNGDGIDDILIGAPRVRAPGGQKQSYVVFGSKQAWPSASFNLIDLNGNNGFAINDNDPNSLIGFSISRAEDVNADGIDDIIIGAPGSNNQTGYVIFGSKASWPSAINLQYINGNNGFAIIGINPLDGCGGSVSGVSDVNGDGIADVLIGANGANNARGQSYVVFGNKGPWPVNISLYLLNGTNGFAINGINPQDFSSQSVSGAGDINGDGIDDILIGAPGAGQSYVIFGQRPLPNKP